MAPRPMIELFKAPSWNFMGRRRWAYMVSVTAILLATLSLAARGLRYDIDFTGGTLVQVRFERPPAIEEIRAALSTVHLGDSIIQEFGEPREYIVRTGGIEDPADLANRVKAAFSGRSALGGFEIRRVEFVGPQVGRDLQVQVLYAVGAGVVGILAYVALRFDLKGAVAAVAAIAHDVLICLGALSVTSREFSLPVLAAVLTIVGYSVNDTIVAYDRLRENRAKSGTVHRDFGQQMNAAINETLSRTVLTALTTFFSAAILLLFGGQALADLAFVLVVGIVTGTYSTIYIASALVVDWTLHIEGRRRRAAAGNTRSR